MYAYTYLVSRCTYVLIQSTHACYTVNCMSSDCMIFHQENPVFTFLTFHYFLDFFAEK
jgi:hypothetical protein